MSEFMTFLDVYPEKEKLEADLEAYFPMPVMLKSGEIVAEGFDQWLRSSGPRKALFDQFWFRMMGRHGGDEALWDPNIGDGELRWRLRFCGVIADQFPKLAEKAEIRARLLGMSDEELADSGLEVTNAAFNPDVAGTSTFDGTAIEKIDTLSQQSTRQGKLSPAQVIQLRLSLMDFDFWEDFMKLFDPLFKKVLFAPKARWEEER